MNNNTRFTQSILSAAREAARVAGVRVPKHLTALQQSRNQWFIESKDEVVRVTVKGDNAYDAKANYIYSLIEKAEEAKAAIAKPYDTTSNLIAFTQGELDEEDMVELFQNLINTGMAWKLEGSVGRQAMALIASGDCILGEVGHRDYWGNYVPSRYEVKAGTKGSIEYSEKMKEGR